MAEVTFRYRGDARSVRLRGSMEALGDTELHRDGDAWSLTLDVPDGTRAVYWFGLDGAEDWLEWAPDPDNPQTYVYPAGLEFTGTHEVVASLLELPDARPYYWSLERDVPHGTLSEREISGRRVWTYEPVDQAEAAMLLFDGHAYTTIAPAQVVLDNLIAEGRIPPTAAVLPDSLDTPRRHRDLGLNEDFLAWVTETLLRSSAVTAPPERTVVAGSSMGGLSATWFAIRRPDLFGNALVQAGGFPGQPVVVPPGLPVRWYLDVGILDGLVRDSTRELRDDLRRAGYAVAYGEYAGGHDFFCWRETLADGLIALLGDPSG
jgi:enterochelin esterase family protein